jgi:hypothetical protein
MIPFYRASANIGRRPVWNWQHYSVAPHPDRFGPNRTESYRLWPPGTELLPKLLVAGSIPVSRSNPIFR